MAARIRVLIVDDSALVRRIVSDGLARFPDIEVVGTAVDPYVARDKILQLNPDVLTLDIEMPRMDGLTFLRLLIKHRPMPVVVMSSLTTAGSVKALEALQAGAVEIMDKPSGSLSAYEDCTRLAEVIRAAAKARIRHAAAAPEPAEPPPIKQSVPRGISSVAPVSGGRCFPPRKVILMGASTGGTEALKAILTKLSGDLPGIAIVQHIPAHFSRAFADRLNDLCAMEVREAQNGDLLHPGLALVAPGGYHMMLHWRGNGYEVILNQGPPLHHQRPAVDVLFRSAVNAGAGPHALGVLLTGMGSDGAVGMLELQNNGALTLAQDEDSCVVFGMPREAIRLGAAKEVLSLGRFSGRIEQYANQIALK